MLNEARRKGACEFGKAKRHERIYDRRTHDRLSPSDGKFRLRTGRSQHVDALAMERKPASAMRCEGE
jgi:hypothetical protein